MGFSSQEYWSGLPCPPPRDLPDPGIKPASLTSPVLAGRFFTTSATWEVVVCILLPKNKKKHGYKETNSGPAYLQAMTMALLKGDDSGD